MHMRGEGIGSEANWMMRLRQRISGWRLGIEGPTLEVMWERMERLSVRRNGRRVGQERLGETRHLLSGSKERCRVRLGRIMERGSMDEQRRVMQRKRWGRRQILLRPARRQTLLNCRRRRVRDLVETLSG
jgi:hypothetical protein